MTEKRSVSLDGHRTSVALEPEFWAAVDRLARARGQSLAGFVAFVDRNRKSKNLASALRLAVLMELEGRVAEKHPLAKPPEIEHRAIRPLSHAPRLYP